MGTELIYEKKYPCENTFLETSFLGDGNNLSDRYNSKTFEEFYGEMMNSTKYIPLPGRIADCGEFIQKAIEISERYSLDTRITRCESHVTVSYSFDCGGKMKYLKEILLLADDYSFFVGVSNRELTISLDYYTHAVCRQGKILAP